jgi:hypothetical protein
MCQAEFQAFKDCVMVRVPYLSSIRGNRADTIQKSFGRKW